MRFTLVIITVSFCSFLGRTQDINETEKKFWEAVRNQNDYEIISKGNTLLTFVQDNNIDIDSIVLEIRLYIADSYFHLNDFERALDLNLKSLEIVIDKWGEEHSQYAVLLNNIAMDYLHLSKYSLALQYILDALNVKEKIIGKNHPSYALSLKNLQIISAQLIEDETELVRKKGKNDLALILKLDDLSDSYFQLDSINRTISLSLNILRKVDSTDSQYLDIIIKNFNRLAFCYEYQGDFNQALKFASQNERFIELKYKRDDDYENYLTKLISIAGYYGKNGFWEQANKLLKGEDKMIISDVLKATYLNELGISEMELGNYDKSIRLLTEAQELNASLYGGNSLENARSLSNIGTAYIDMGLTDQALNIFLQALEIKLQILPEQHLSIGIAYNQLAVTYSNIGDLNKALEFMMKAIEIDALNHGENHPSLAISKLNLSELLKEAGLPKQALAMEVEALKILEYSLGKNNYEYASALVNTSATAAILGYDEKALEFAHKALNILKSIKSDSSKVYALCLGEIGANYYSILEYEKSIQYYFEASELIKKLLGQKTTEYSACMENIAFAYYKLKEIEKFQKYVDLSFNSGYNEFQKNKSALSNSEQELYKNKIIRSFLILANSSLIVKDSLGQLNNYWIKLNSLLSSSKNILTNKILNSEDQELRELFNKLLGLRRQYNNYSEKEFHAEKIQMLLQDCERIEREIWKNFSEFEEIDRVFTAADVVRNLNTSDVFIEIARIPYFSFNSNEWTDSVKYLVFISNASDTIVDHFFINEGKELESELQFAYKSEASDKSKATDLKNQIFYNFFWKPIADKIGNAKTVYVSLGGVYNNINLNTLYNPETGKYLIEEKDIRIVNSARDFVLGKERLSTEAGEKKQYISATSALYGFPDFNGNITSSADTTDYLAATRDLNQIWIDSLTRGGMKASSLPATKVEVEQIAGTFQKNGWKVSTYTGENASETNIKKEESPRVLHVATHGYFFEDIPMDKTDDRFLGMDRQVVMQDPMLRSGLLFTGANKTLQGEEPKGENGLLSAAEASLLDLRETELVVLSACETGKGEIKNSEGVYGLRKAFSDAGAKNIIMSLWKVDDKVTQEFMTRFYEIWLNEKTTIREAFNRTQLEIKAKYPQPYYWGAFILVGE